MIKLKILYSIVVIWCSEYLYLKGRVKKMESFMGDVRGGQFHYKLVKVGLG